MSEGETLDPAARQAGDGFFFQYEWCLNPIRSLDDLRQRIGDELRRYDTLERSWQREEVRINLYLLVCAACCTVDDYIAYRPWSLMSVARRFPRARIAVPIVRFALNAIYMLSYLSSVSRVRRWRDQVASCVDLVCEILVVGSAEAPSHWQRLRQAAQVIEHGILPPRVKRWRMRIPEAFRCQDMSHHDVIAMAQRYVELGGSMNRPALVIGPRTAGAYFAPLVAASLAARGVPVSGWLTLRPKDGVSRREVLRLRKGRARGARILVVDDHPNTGNTFTILIALLQHLGVPPEDIVIIAPEHPAERNWRNSLSSVATVTLPFADFSKQRLLNDGAAVASLLREFHSAQGWEDVELIASDPLDDLNESFLESHARGFQVRLKRLFEIRLSASGRAPMRKRVLAKSVGWGWLGYHAYIAGNRLAGYVPPVIGCRFGILFMEWVGDLDCDRSRADTEAVAAILPSYLAARTEVLRLAEDPSFGSIGYRRTGWDLLVDTLRRPYGPYIGRFKIAALRARLREYLSPLPTLLDGRMGRCEWVANAGSALKVDFEHHNFGGAEQDLVDSAYDLAGAVYELGLSENDERRMVQIYGQRTGDLAIEGRLLLHKLLYGTLVMESAIYWLALDSPPELRERWNCRYQSARDFLVYQMNRHCADTLAAAPPPAWSGRLFFLDLDGVYDRDFLGFPHTTPNGLQALRLLKAHGYSVVLNTGRSVEHVRDYCQRFALQGGIAEYGALFVDNVRRVEMPLYEAEAREQLTRLRELVRKLPGVFVDPGYRSTVRAYRYGNGATLGLARSELAELIDRAGLDKLKFMAKELDSYVLPKNCDKGSAFLKVRELFGGEGVPTVAIGDSIEDLEMLQAADIAYIPSNGAKQLRELARGPKCRKLRKPAQRGLLTAVRLLVRGDAVSAHDIGMNVRSADRGHLIDDVLRAADLPRPLRLVAPLRTRQRA
jgi:hydroxymethylpyrimidine pyrophosphatase-like HAD family hydrolase/adenine/guanine phosphoribosyltransferase-like PRPP-binding protein